MAFWRWYDRASRADFGGTLLGFIFDWKGWISAAIGGGGGVVTFIKAAVDGRSPLDVWVLALVVIAALMVIVYLAISILEKSKNSKLIAGRGHEHSAADIKPDLTAREETTSLPSDLVAPIPIDDAALGAYMRSNRRVRRLDKRIADDADLKVDEDRTSMSWIMEEQAHFLGISDIKQLDALLDENEEAVVRLAHYSWSEQRPISVGESVWYLLEILAARLGREKYDEFLALCSRMSGQGDGAFLGSEQIAAYPITQRPKPLTDQLQTTDFNLIPIADAARLFRSKLAGSGIGQKTEAIPRINDDDLLVEYCILLGPRVRLYGRSGNDRFRRPLSGKQIFLKFSIDQNQIKAHFGLTEYRDLFVLKPDIEPAAKRLLEHDVFCRNRDSQIGGFLIQASCWELGAGMDDTTLF